jgi:hypothetical protein
MAEGTASEKFGDVTNAIESDVELQAMRAVLGALVPLKREGRERVLDYVLNRLGMRSEAAVSVASESSYSPGLTDKSAQVTAAGVANIRSLKEEKAPRSANEMAALVAYYLAELAPERKQSINADDIKKYFLEARYELPHSTSQLLINAKNSGYLESAGTGQYKLNSVGYNLVMHKLGGSSGATTPTRRPRNRQRRGRATPRK